MDTKSIWGILASIPIGTIVAWVIVIAAIISALCTVVIKLYKAFDKTHKLKEENNNFKILVEEHTRQLTGFECTLNDIKKALDEQRDVNLKQIRHEIVNSCEIALKNNCITTSSLCSLEEMYEEYKNIFHGNGYVKTLIEKVRKLKVLENFEN